MLIPRRWPAPDEAHVAATPSNSPTQEIEFLHRYQLGRGRSRGLTRDSRCRSIKVNYCDDATGFLTMRNAGAASCSLGAAHPRLTPDAIVRFVRIGAATVQRPLPWSEDLDGKRPRLTGRPAGPTETSSRRDRARTRSRGHVLARRLAEAEPELEPEIGVMLRKITATGRTQAAGRPVVVATGDTERIDTSPSRLPEATRRDGGNVEAFETSPSGAVST